MQKDVAFAPIRSFNLRSESFLVLIVWRKTRDTFP